MIHENINSKQELHNHVNERYISVYRNLTNILSSTLRKLAFAEGAICWLLISSASYLLSSEIKIILFILLLFLIFDTLQYYMPSLKYKKLAEFYESEINSGNIKCENQLKRDPNADKIGQIFFYLKISVLMLSTLFLFFVMFFKIPNQNSVSQQLIYLSHQNLQ